MLMMMTKVMALMVVIMKMLMVILGIADAGCNAVRYWLLFVANGPDGKRHDVAHADNVHDDDHDHDDDDGDVAAVVTAVVALFVFVAPPSRRHSWCDHNGGHNVHHDARLAEDLLTELSRAVPRVCQCSRGSGHPHPRVGDWGFELDNPKP